MPNGDMSLVQKSVHARVYKGICQLCQQPTNAPFTYMGRLFTKPNEINASKAHVVSQFDGGRWANGNILEAHMYCNLLMQTVSDLEWLVSTFFSHYTNIEHLNAKLSEADTLYKKVQAAMDGKVTIDEEVLAVLKPVAHKIRTQSESNAVKRMYPKRRETILALVA
jgi:hypothetical protein